VDVPGREVKFRIIYTYIYFDLIGSLIDDNKNVVYVCTPGVLRVSSLMCAIKRLLRGALQRGT
jgi:hypothetical protein